MKNRTFDGDGPFEGGEVGMGFTVFRGFPYCAKCHAKLRWPKCKKCKKGMAPDSDIIEALGAKWCADCFVCTVCDPFRAVIICELSVHCFSPVNLRSGMVGSSCETTSRFAKIALR